MFQALTIPLCKLEKPGIKLYLRSMLQAIVVGTATKKVGCLLS